MPHGPQGNHMYSQSIIEQIRKQLQKPLEDKSRQLQDLASEGQDLNEQIKKLRENLREVKKRK
jgi:chaperonin cofactor prefoldin